MASGYNPKIYGRAGHERTDPKSFKPTRGGKLSKRAFQTSFSKLDQKTDETGSFSSTKKPMKLEVSARPKAKSGQGISEFFGAFKPLSKTITDEAGNVAKAVTDARYAVIGSSPYKTVEGVLFGAKDYAPYVRKLLAEHGTKKILSLTAYRKPVDKPLIAALNVVSLGQFAKQNPYDELFHLSLVAQMEDGFISIEKIENINLVLNPTTHPKAESQVIGNFRPLTLNELMEGGKRVMGDKFFKYDASNNNCQDFIMALLKGSNLGTPENYKFIKQDTEQIFKGLDKTRALSVAVTDLGNRASVARYGGKVKKENPWFAHVRKYAKEHNMSYTQAMKPASATYKSKL